MQSDEPGDTTMDAQVVGLFFVVWFRKICASRFFLLWWWCDMPRTGENRRLTPMIDNSDVDFDDEEVMKTIS